MRAFTLSLWRFLLLCVSLHFSTISISTAQRFSFDGKRKSQSISFELVRNLILVPLFINEKGPYQFILDTGVSPLIITDSTILNELNLQKLRQVKISGLGRGTDLDALLSNQISARIGKATIKNIPTAILKEDVLGLSNYVGKRIYGLIGYHFFSSFVTEINYTNRRLKFYLPNISKKIKGQSIPIEILNGKPYTNINIKISDHKSLSIKVVIDNGASHAISLETLNDQPFPLPPHAIPANLGVGLGGPISGNIGRIPALEIGGFILEDVLSSYPIYEDAASKALLSNRNGNLGAEILSRFNITFDYNNDLMYLRRNAGYKRPFNHDMSGIEVYVEEKPVKRYFIGRIEPNSPASEAGLAIGDEILTINFINAGALDLNDFTRYLRSEHGKNLYFSINRFGDLLIKTIKLKKRI